MSMHIAVLANPTHDANAGASSASVASGKHGLSEGLSNGTVLVTSLLLPLPQVRVCCVPSSFI